jgi:hypothetical protein
VLDGVDPQAFDMAQRAALLEYVRGGGVIVLSAPVDALARAGTWLAPLLPVNLIGTREAKQLDVLPGGAPLKLRRAVPIVEAVGTGNCQVLLGDRDYIHAAVQPVGLGRIVFTSFPINALDTAQPQAAEIWERLLSLREPRWDWNRSQLGEARHEIVSSMMGRKVASWSVAAGMAAGYLLVIVAAQGLFFGAARPRAFVVSVAAALALSAALLAMGVARRSEQSLQSARVAVADVGPTGGGWQTETVAFVGADDPQMRLEPKDERVVIRPALSDGRNRPTVRQQPFAVEKSEVFTDRVERVWEATGPADPAWRISAVAQFGPNGVTFDVDNGLGETLKSPLLIWNGRALAIADLPVGQTAVHEFQVNPRQQYTGLGVLTSDQAKRRAQVVAASLAPANELARVADAPPVLVGWMSNAGESLIRQGDRHHVESKSMVMVRTPLNFGVAPSGSAVSVPAALVRIDTGRLPYDGEKGESVPTPQGGSWQITFAPPPQVGRVKPDKITIAARVTLPSHTMRLKTTSPSSSSNEPAEWSRTAGAAEKTFECASGDYDEQGRIKNDAGGGFRRSDEHRAVADQRPARDHRRHDHRTPRAARARRNDNDHAPLDSTAARSRAGEVTVMPIDRSAPILQTESADQDVRHAHRARQPQPHRSIAAKSSATSGPTARARQRPFASSPACSIRRPAAR